MLSFGNNGKVIIVTNYVCDYEINFKMNNSSSVDLPEMEIVKASPFSLFGFSYAKWLIYFYLLTK